MVPTLGGVRVISIPTYTWEDPLVGRMLLPLGGAPISISFRSGVSNTCPDLTASDANIAKLPYFSPLPFTARTYLPKLTQYNPGVSLLRHFHHPTDVSTCLLTPVRGSESWVCP